MQRFIIKCSLFFVIILLLFFSIALFKENNSISSDYMAAIIDKHKLIDSIKTPKIIFGGGSNLAFGIDSKELENAFGVPVINMGLHAGLGLDFILNDLKYSIKPNDIVFLSIEYFLPKEGSYSLQLNTSNYFPPAETFYTKNYFLQFEAELENNRAIFKNIFLVKDNKLKSGVNKSSKIPIYSREAFNQNGDVISHLGEPNPEMLNDREIILYRYWEGITEINEFDKYAKAKKVNVFFLFPNYPASEYEKNKKAITALESDLKQNLKIEILNKPNDLVFPDNYFFNTVYHLNKLGRIKRTQKIIELIGKNTKAQHCIAKMQAELKVLNICCPIKNL